MREIKFRIWDKKKKTFVKYVNNSIGDDVYFGIGLLGGICAVDRFGDDVDCDEEDFFVQEFIGFRDKNSKDIYEGDIITYVEKMHEHSDVQFLSGQVVYDTNKAAFGIAGIESGEIWNYFSDMVVYNFEVVGNILENGKR